MNIYKSDEEQGIQCISSFSFALFDNSVKLLTPDLIEPFSSQTKTSSPPPHVISM